MTAFWLFHRMSHSSSQTATITDTAGTPPGAVRDSEKLLQNIATEADEIITKDFGLIPIPKRLRYDSSKPFHFGIALNIAFGFASTFGEYYS